MKRRTFIKNTLLAGIASGILLPQQLMATETAYPDVVLAYGKKPGELLSLSLRAIGGLTQFNLTGKRILIKPTIKWDATPQEALNTNPELVYHLIRQCYNAKAWEVYVLDHTSNDWRLCYMNSGIEKASKEAFGKIIPANERRLFKKGNNGFLLHEMAHKCDLIINVPKLNVGIGDSLVGAMKNLEGLTWENGNFDASQSDQKLVDLAATIKPVLTVMDVLVVGNGQNRQQLDLLITGTNGVNVDIMASQIIGIDPNTIGYLRLAAQQGYGTLFTNELTIEKIYI